jgi:hypothetical protein
MHVKESVVHRTGVGRGTDVQVEQFACREGCRTSVEESIDLVNDGTTSLDEALKHIMVD